MLKFKAFGFFSSLRASTSKANKWEAIGKTGQSYVLVRGQVRQTTVFWLQIGDSAFGNHKYWFDTESAKDALKIANLFDQTLTEIGKLEKIYDQRSN